jgi:hypothetical protein
MSTQTPQVAHDAHARERLREVDTAVDAGGHGRIITLDTDDYSIVAYINNGADAAALHEGLAAVWQTADDVMHLNHTQPAPDGGAD